MIFDFVGLFWHPTPTNVQFLYFANAHFFGVILDPLPLKIRHHLCMFPSLTNVASSFRLQKNCEGLGSCGF